ncbi:MAG: hypothetical protein J2P17_08250 [Mycobacterium sp.]|nr:hypothetical protein [Mycobacterium sp.]
MTATLQPIERSVLESIADGRDDIQTAAQLRVPVNTVAAIQQRFGPGRDRIRQVLDADQLARMPAPLRPIGGNRPPVEPTGIEAILNEAKHHTQQRIVKKGARIQQLVDELAAALKEERQAEKQRRREQLEREAALVEIAQLEEQLATLRAKAKIKPRGRPKGSNPKNAGVNLAASRAAQDAWLQERGATFSEVLAWAKEQGIQKAGSILSNSTKSAWDDAHKA